MSFSVNTNVLAMTAMNNLDNVNDQLSTSMERLSTGLRINTAADDPAEFIASQGFSAQIGGMSQAIQNTQEAINYSKTAEGAFTEVNSLLNSARSLAVAAGNTSTQSSTEIQADQQQLNSIVSSINRIASTTQYGTKNLLDGSSGTQSVVTDGTKFASLSITGEFGGAALTASSTVTLNSLTAATQASVDSKGFAALTTAVSAGSFSINGATFTTTASNTVGDVINMINSATNQTGVTATFDGSEIQVNSVAYGSNASININDTNGVLLSSAGSDSQVGTDATAVLDIGGTTANFTGSLNGTGGLTLSDANGNNFTLAAAGNTTTTTAAAVGQVIVGTSQFQIGANSGQTASLSLGNYSATNLGTGVVSGLNMSNLDVTTATGASNALTVIDKAIQDVTQIQGTIGNFESNVLQTNVQSLTTQQTNLSASLSTIEDTNVAQEMTNFTKLQILEQTGMSMLAQANQMPSNVLNLVKGG